MTSGGRSSLAQRPLATVTSRPAPATPSCADSPSAPPTVAFPPGPASAAAPAPAAAAARAARRAARGCTRNARDPPPRSTARTRPETARFVTANECASERCLRGARAGNDSMQTRRVRLVRGVGRGVSDQYGGRGGRGALGGHEAFVVFVSSWAVRAGVWQRTRRNGRARGPGTRARGAPDKVGRVQEGEAVRGLAVAPRAPDLARAGAVSAQNRRVLIFSSSHRPILVVVLSATGRRGVIRNGRS